MLIIAHRGTHLDVEENTLAACQLASRAGHGIEIDVRLASDGTPVLHHDPDRAGTPVGKLPPDHFTRFDEVLDLETPLLDVEIKEPAAFDPVLERLSFDPATVIGSRPLVFSSFHHSVVQRAIEAGYDAGSLLGSRRDVSRWRVDRDRLGDLVIIDHRLVDEIRDEAAVLGLRVWVWTVNRSTDWRRGWNDPLIDAIITDQPDRLRADIRG